MKFVDNPAKTVDNPRALWTNRSIVPFLFKKDTPYLGVSFCSSPRRGKGCQAAQKHPPRFHKRGNCPNPI